MIEARLEAVVGRTFWELPWWAALPISAARVRQAVLDAASGRRARFDVEHQAFSSGQATTRWVFFEAVPERDPSGTIVRVAVSGVDITDHKAVEEARARSEDQLARAVQVADVGFYEWDVQRDLLVFSDHMKAQWGFSGSETLADTAKRIHPDDREATLRKVQAAMERRTPYLAEYRVVHEGGRVVWIEAQGEVTYDPAGRPARFFGTSVDITARKRAELELAAQRHTLEAIFHSAPAAMALWRGPELVFELVNREYQQIFGERPLAGLPLLEAVPELADQEFPAQIRRVLETGEPLAGSEVLARLASRAGGPLEDHYYDFSYVRLEDPAGQPLGVFDHAVDVTERVRARRQLERTVSELERERTLRERFVAALSHDLRSPLGVVRLCVERLQRLDGLDEQAHVLAARMLKNLQRVDQMIEDQLDAQSLGAGGRLQLRLEACDLREVAAAAVKDLTSVHGDRFVLRTSGDLTGRLDCKYIRRVIENLCANAVKYGAQRPTTLTLERDGRDAVLSVHNHGAPIPASDQAQLFEAFRRAPSARAGGTLGWGLGLLLVRGAIEAHGGTVGVRSSPEEGTTFTARLPLEPPAAA